MIIRVLSSTRNRAFQQFRNFSRYVELKKAILDQYSSSDTYAVESVPKHNVKTNVTCIASLICISVCYIIKVSILISVVVFFA